MKRRKAMKKESLARRIEVASFVFVACLGLGTSNAVA
jgi:hypothetical protein